MSPRGGAPSSPAPSPCLHLPLCYLVTCQRFIQASQALEATPLGTAVAKWGQPPAPRDEFHKAELEARPSPAASPPDIKSCFIARRDTARLTYHLLLFGAPKRHHDRAVDNTHQGGDGRGQRGGRQHGHHQDARSLEVPCRLHSGFHVSLPVRARLWPDWRTASHGRLSAGEWALLRQMLLLPPSPRTNTIKNPTPGTF